MKVFRSRIFDCPHRRECLLAKVDAGALLENYARVAEDFDGGLRKRDAAPP
jgi:hypothetical protein